MADEHERFDRVALTPEQAYVALDELLKLARRHIDIKILPDTVRGWVDRLGEKGVLPARAEPTGSIFVETLVAARNRHPYVRITDDQGHHIAQLSTRTARELAHNILNGAAAAEADAMIHRFFQKMEFPDAAVGALMHEFRAFRAELEQEDEK